MFKKLALKWGTSYLIKKLDDLKFQETIVAAVNRKIDIPRMTEHQEKELFKAILKALTAYIKGI